MMGFLRNIPFRFVVILLLGSFFLTYRLNELMMFIGDFGWFYLSAREMLMTGTFPLVGIPSSHPWLHQGALWTYLLAPGFLLTNFHPLSGAYTAVLFGIGSIILIYRCGKELISEQGGLLAALLYATSPLIIIHARMPYHTAPIPFFTLLFFYALLRMRAGKYGFLPLCVFSLVLLYQLELATVLYVVFFIIFLGYEHMKKKSVMNILRNRGLVLTTMAAGIIPLLPILLYDFTHGFPQTAKFAAWIGYKVLVVFGYPPLHTGTESPTYADVYAFFADHIRKLLFLPNSFIANGLFIACIVYFVYVLYTHRRLKNSEKSVLLGLFVFIGLGGFFIAKTPSEAYLPMLFPGIILVITFSLLQLCHNKQVRMLVVSGLFVMIVLNSIQLLGQQYLMGVFPGGYGIPFSEREAIASQIVKDAEGKRYTIKGTGAGSEYQSFTMNYEYLTWWLGNPPRRGPERIQFIIHETPEYATVRRVTR